MITSDRIIFSDCKPSVGIFFHRIARHYLSTLQLQLAGSRCVPLLRLRLKSMKFRHEEDERVNQSRTGRLLSLKGLRVK